MHGQQNIKICPVLVYFNNYITFVPSCVTFKPEIFPFSAKIYTKDSVVCMSILIYKISRCHFSERGNLHSLHRKNIKSHDTSYVQNVNE